MIPTFLGITLLIFAVLNFAPGKPGALAAATENSDGRGAETQESQRIFREQFGLDKPVLLNRLFSLEREPVENALRRSAGIGEVTIADRLAAQEELESFGGYAVPHVVGVARDANAAGDRALRDAALGALPIAARRPLIDPFADDPPPEVLAANREIDRENAQLREWRFAAEAPEERRVEVLELWGQWFDENADRWNYDTSDKLRIFFLETRFARYWRNLVRLDFGISLVSREPVLDTLISKLPYSLALSVGSLLLAYLIAIPLGILSAVSRDSATDRTTTVTLFMLYSLPSFFVATLLLYFFSAASDTPALRFFPTGGFQSREAAQLTSLEQIGDIAWHLVLPLTCMTYGSLAALSRYMRTGLLDVIAADYVRTARAKGLPEWQVIGKHAVRNGLLPILTLLAGLLPAVLGGSVIIEFIFGIPGMGLWVVESIYQRDYNAIMVVQLFSTVLVLVGILLTDLSYALVDPRIRYQ